VIEPFALIQSYGYSLGRGQSVHITTKVGSYNITCGIVYSIQLLHDKVCLQVAACSWFLRVNQFLSIMTAMLQ
jgi:hypothetical protein